MNRNPGLGPQLEVPQLLGTCLLQLQGYERLLKAILIKHEMAFTSSDLDALQSSRAQRFAGKTLGQLVQYMFEAYLLVEGADRPIPGASAPTNGQVSMGFQFSIQMPQERWLQTKSAIEELVAMRNELVHHLIERFDLSCETGNADAAKHLQQCSQRIESHHLELRQWAARLGDAATLQASFIHSEEFQDMFLFGIEPDGTFEWPATAIVSALREGIDRVGENGWACLPTVLDWIRVDHPSLVPERYSCKSWPQVLTESGFFNLEYRVDADGRRVAWYRLRPGMLP